MWRRFSNSAWAISEYAWNPALVFVCTPLFLRTLGNEKYGLWMLLVATVGFGAILNAGTGAATIKHVSAHIGRENPLQLQHVVQGSLAIAVIGGGVLALIIVSVFWFGDNLFFGKMGERSLLHATGFCAAILSWIEQIDNVFASCLRGSERYGIAAKTEICAKSAQMLLLSLAMFAGAGIIAVYSILVFSALARLCAKMLAARNVLALKALYPRIEYTRDILSFSAWAWMQGLGGMMFNSSDKFLVGSILGAASLAQYSVITQLTMQIHGVAAAAVSVIFPMISRKRARDPSFSIAGATARVLSANIALSTLIGTLLLVFGNRILRVWLGTEVSPDSILLLKYLTVAYFLLAMNITPYYVLLGVGRVRIVAVWVMISGVSGLIPLVYAITHFALVGAGIGRLVYSVAALLLFVPLAQVLRTEKHKVPAPF